MLPEVRLPALRRSLHALRVGRGGIRLLFQGRLMVDETWLRLGSFPQTQWSMVFRAGDDRDRREALGELLRRYLPALRAHLIRRKTMTADRAADLLQDFVADKIVEQNLIGCVTGTRGKFRTFLLTALDNFAISRMRRDTARKRSPGRMRSLEECLAGEICAEDAPDPFDVAWVREVLSEVLERMRAGCQASDRADIWGIFECRVLNPTLNREAPLPYEELVVRFHLKSPAQAANVLVSAKRMFVRTLRSVVSEYTKREDEVEDEIKELMEILSQSGAGSA